MPYRDGSQEMEDAACADREDVMPDAVLQTGRCDFSKCLGVLSCVAVEGWAGKARPATVTTSVQISRLE